MMQYEIGVLKRRPLRWKLVFAVWATLAILATIPQIGISTLNYQADAECSIIVDGQQMVYGEACDQYFPK